MSGLLTQDLQQPNRGKEESSPSQSDKTWVTRQRKDRNRVFLRSSRVRTAGATNNRANPAPHASPKHTRVLLSTVSPRPTPRKSRSARPNFPHSHYFEGWVGLIAPGLMPSPRPRERPRRHRPATTPTTGALDSHGRIHRPSTHPRV